MKTEANKILYVITNENDELTSNLLTDYSEAIRLAQNQICDTKKLSDGRTLITGSSTEKRYICRYERSQ